MEFTEAHAVLVAAFIAFVSSVVSKDVKTSEFRQAWIDALRSDIAKLIAHSVAIRGIKALAASGSISAIDILAMAKDDYQGINVAKTTILLRLNPKDAAVKPILAGLAELERLTDDHTSTHSAACIACEQKLTTDAQLLLKEEWERVKEGEPLFWWTKVIALFLVIAGSLLWGVLKFNPGILPVWVVQAFQ